MKLSKDRVAQIQAEVLDWYRANKRDLPWRKTQDPYAILVSEIMLQQTQVSRVIPKYLAFLSEFPTIQVLAAASPAAVIRSWAGLGYNRRALNVQRAARIIIDQCQGQFPQSADELTTLPGLGRYTAGAVATFAFRAVVPAVDTNVRRFIDAIIPSRTLRTENDYYDLARQLVPADRPAEWLHAVMDFVALQPERFRRPRLSPLSNRGSGSPFVGSNRYLRGQVIDRLRVRPASEAELYRRVAQPVVVDGARFALQLAALERDGMIERHQSHYRLPQ